jgi:Tol biopolymer transport system component/outer membrane protein assembly factor BamB
MSARLRQAAAWVGAAALIAASQLGSAPAASAVTPGLNGDLLFSRCAPSGTPCHIVEVPPSGGATVVLTKGSAHDRSPAWSPDGTRIAFASDVTGTSQIWIMNADGSNPTRLTKDGANDSTPAWSPDGTKIAFTSDQSGNGDVWRIDVDGSNLTQLTTDPAFDGFPDWSPDGTRIAFQSARSGTSDIWTVRPSGGGLQHVIKSDSEDRDPAWSPDGTRIAYGSDRSGNQDIWTVLADGSGRVQVTTSRYQDIHPAWAPQGNRIAFASNRGAPYSIWTALAGGGSEKRITNPGTSTDDMPAWRSLAMTSWAQPRFDPQHTGWNRFEGTLSAGNVSGLHKVWENIQKGIDTTAVVAGNVLYWTNGPTLRADDATTGDSLWATVVGSEHCAGIDVPPVVGDGIVYVTTGNGVYAVDIATHDVLWHKDASDCLTGTTLADGMLFFSSHDDSVYAIDAATGTFLWSRSTGDQIESAPTVDGSRVLVGSSDGNVYAIREKNGRVVWTHPATPAFLKDPPVAMNGFVYVPGSHIAVLDESTGQLDHTIDASTSRWAMTSDQLFVGGTGIVAAYDNATGNQLWSTSTGGTAAVEAPPVVANGLVYAVDVQGYLTVYDAQSGQRQLRLSTGAKLQNGSPVVVNGKVYTVDDDSDSVTAFGL